MASRQNNLAQQQQRKEPEVQQGEFGPWTMSSIKSHILESDGAERERFEKELELPQLPEMVFGGNKLTLTHKDGFGIEFSALDALKMVDAHNDPLKVAAAKVWREARADCEHIQNVVKPFDWTFSTHYKGTLCGKPAMKVTETSEHIDIEKLKQRERICFYDDIVLFEDELSDNGCSILSVKIRVMPTSFFVLLRFFMRVDQVMVRIADTRIYHETSWNYILREYTCKDETTDKLKVPAHVLTDPNEISKHLPVRVELYEKLVFPGTESLAAVENTDKEVPR
ncbi:TIP41-like protein [Littorina saxatilis]|uniref:TIP41-like protein n=1 Tax=Littorina saxatilis TaxID=31220 RepID=A0AAN9BLE0_9CAEN